MKSIPMKSIQIKTLILILSVVILTAFATSASSVLILSRGANHEAREIMNLTCEKNAESLNTLFAGIEQSVDTLAIHVETELESMDRLQRDEEYRDQYTKSIEEAALNHAECVEGALSVFLRFNPDYTTPTAGMFWAREDLGENFQEIPTTDLSVYEPTDRDRVGWYYEPVEKGEPVWMQPYQNGILNKWIITYVVPVYKDGILIGVIGMDIDFRRIEEEAAKICVYDTGYAFITGEDGTLMYHPTYQYGEVMEEKDKSLLSAVQQMKQEKESKELLTYEIEGRKTCMAYCNLINGMNFCISVPEAEINREKNELMIKNILVTILLSCVAAIAGAIFSRHFAKPLRELNTVAKKIAEGDFDVSIECTSKDEVGELADSLGKMSESLKQYVDTLNSLAYRDSMTGVRNKAANHQIEERLREQIEEKNAHFAVVVFDVNNLKKTNDLYGHMAGDDLIINVSHEICQTFKHSPVFRIGGDEFVAILETKDLDEYESLLEQFRNKTEQKRLEDYPELVMSVACGAAVYDSDMDTCVADVFQKADYMMYQNKLSMKQKTKG